MLGVDKIGKIRRSRYCEGRSIKGISRDLGVSRTTSPPFEEVGPTYVFEAASDAEQSVSARRS